VAQLAQTLEECEAKVVAAATPGEVAEAFAAEDRLHELFRAVEVPGLSPELTERVLGEIRDRYEGQHRVEITDARSPRPWPCQASMCRAGPCRGARSACSTGRRPTWPGAVRRVASTDIAVKGRNLPVYRVVAVTEADVAAVAASAANRS